MEGLCKAVAARHRRLDPVLLTLIWQYLSRVARRFASLATRIQSGTLRASRPRTTPRKPPSKPRQRLPSRFAWLCALVPPEPTLFGVAGYGTQIAHMIRTDPEMQALIAATPRMARLLRPLLRALGVEDAPGVLPPPKPPRPAKPPKVLASSEERLRRRDTRAEPPGISLSQDPSREAREVEARRRTFIIGRRFSR